MADLEAFKRDLKRDLKDGREAFEGKYAKELESLMGLSRDEIDAVTPGKADLEAYDQLISVVRLASKHNLSQAQLVGNIKKLGKVAVSIAKKSSKLAGLGI
jgi:hypothetical protein